jgi:hypothetical protein
MTRTDVHPFKSVAVVTVNMSAHYSITALERAFSASDCTTVYALLIKKFMSFVTLAAEISIINGSLLRHCAASPQLIGSRLSNILSYDHIIVMMSDAGIMSLKRSSF